MKKTYFVSSDIHSYYDEYRFSLSKLGFDESNPNHYLILCGDAFDRGPKSAELLEFLLNFPKERRTIIKGNHEDLLEEIFENGYLSSYDLSNRTADTICNISEKTLDFVYRNLEATKAILENKGLFKLISEMVNYAEIGDYIFVHGWIPTKSELNEHLQRVHKYNSNWRDADDEDWATARWINGMEAFNQNCGVKDKTIVCGHWHSSYGHVRKQHKGLSDKQYYQLEFSDTTLFEPFYDTKRKKSIIALDGCTAFTNQVNVVKLEIDE